MVLIINSSYTASLTSILTVQQLTSPIKGIDSLISSKDPIGYQQGSFTRDYLINELGIHKSRLISLKMPEDYAKALKDGPHKGGVAAVVDERAYLELFLSNQCEFSIVGREFTKNGWGFVSASKWHNSVVHSRLFYWIVNFMCLLSLTFPAYENVCSSSFTRHFQETRL